MGRDRPMQLREFHDPVPDDDDLTYSIEHWDGDRIRGEIDAGARFTDGLFEAYVHPRTGTAARIIENSDGGFSVQPTMGGFADYDCVVQPDAPNEFVSGSASVLALDLESLAEARAMAYAWLHGWVLRNSNVGDSGGDVRDRER